MSEQHDAMNAGLTRRRIIALALVILALLAFGVGACSAGAILLGVGTNPAGAPDYALGAGLALFVGWPLVLLVVCLLASLAVLVDRRTWALPLILGWGFLQLFPLLIFGTFSGNLPLSGLGALSVLALLLLLTASAVYGARYVMLRPSYRGRYPLERDGPVTQPK